MAAKVQSRLHEVLVRFGPSGFSGAHAIDIEELVDGKEVRALRELDPRPVTEAELGELLGSETARLIETVDTTRAFADEMVEGLELAKREVARLTKREETLTEQLAAAVKGGEALSATVKRMAPAAAAYEALRSAAGAASEGGDAEGSDAPAS